MNTKQLLDTYYNGFAKKENWESVISDDFKFYGGDMTNKTPIIGIQGYIKVIDRFSKVFTNMKVKNMVIDGDKASVIGNYDYTFPNGKKMNGDVAEIWEVKNGKLDSLAIFFDTLTFDNNSKIS